MAYSTVEKRRAYQRKYYAEHREQELAREKTEKRKAQRRAWYQAHKAEQQERMRAWYQANAEKIKLKKMGID